MTDEFHAELQPKERHKFEPKVNPTNEREEPKEINGGEDSKNNIPEVTSLRDIFDAQCTRLSKCNYESLLNLPTKTQDTKKHYESVTPAVKLIFKELETTCLVSINTLGAPRDNGTLKPNEIAVKFPPYTEKVFTYKDDGYLYAEGFNPIEKRAFINWVKERAQN